MEFGEKLQELRKQKNLTQEELAQKLYVSRTAISKWESGRGYPGIDSLKEIANFFSVSVDQLLSNEEILTVASEDSKKRVGHLRDLVYGLLDICIVVYLFLPFFGQRVNGEIQEVSLINLTENEMYIIVPYYIIIFALLLTGIATLALQNSTWTLWLDIKTKLSLILSAMGTLLFIMSMQPYTAMFTFLFLVIKALMLIKWA